MLVGGSVVDDMRDQSAAGRTQVRATADVAEHRLDRQRRMAIANRAFDLEERVLGMIEQDEPLRTARGYLTGEFGTNGTAGTGNQDALAGQCNPIGGVEHGTHGPAQEPLLELGRQPNRAH
jgi:hypothetical protein